MDLLTAPETLEWALTIRHPFAYASAAGWKPIENKTERPPLARIGQPIGIHAGLEWARKSDLPFWAKSYEMPAPTDSRLVYGALIGVARLRGVVRQCGDTFDLMLGRSVGQCIMEPTLRDRIRPWWRGPWGWLLEEAVLLPEPIPMRGQQGLWRLPDVTTEVAGGFWSARGVALEQWRKAREAKR